MNKLTETEMMPVASPANLLELAINNKVDVGQLEKLTQLYEQWEAKMSKKAFLQAFTHFQGICPDIRKTKEVSYNGSVKYYFAPLSDITRQILPSLEKCGLSYRWEIQDDNSTIQVTCIVSHVNGHSESTTMSSPADESGSKNKIQSRGSAVEYLKRYTLIGALGISTADSDIDGRIPVETTDKLHQEYMEIFNKLLSYGKKYDKYHPDLWKTKPTAKMYSAAIGEVRKMLFEEQNKKQ
jgi:hypothetical protein